MPDREVATVRTWLADHPGIKIVSRDRGGGYGEATAKALPDAVQVADRWHLMENASSAFLDAVRKSMRAIRSAIGSTTITVIAYGTTKAGDERQSDKPATNIVPRTIANPQASTPATAAAGDEIVIDDRHLLVQRRVAKMLGYHPADAATLARGRQRPPEHEYRSQGIL